MKKRTTPSERDRYWLEHEAALAKSGQTAKDYAAEQGLSLHALYQARKRLRNIARLDQHGLIVSREEIQSEYAAIEKLLIDCYLKVARILLQERNYKGAVEYVRKILLYDPIHEEALEMVEEIRKNRITFKLSDITNARPRVTGG